MSLIESDDADDRFIAVKVHWVQTTNIYNNNGGICIVKKTRLIIHISLAPNLQPGHEARVNKRVRKGAKRKKNVMAMDNYQLLLCLK